jgi:hypothetical protein
VIEYKGYFSSINRKACGKYQGKVTGINDTDVDIEAGSICQLRQLFEAIVDEYIHRQACGLTLFGKKKKNDSPDIQN